MGSTTDIVTEQGSMPKGAKGHILINLASQNTLGSPKDSKKGFQGGGTSSSVDS